MQKAKSDQLVREPGNAGDHKGVTTLHVKCGESRKRRERSSAGKQKAARDSSDAERRNPTGAANRIVAKYARSHSAASRAPSPL
jgi:hypothetical protein